MMPKTPALTTATACSNALTGVGATIALGSQEWTGIQAALANPSKKQKKMICSVMAEDAFNAGFKIP